MNSLFLKEVKYVIWAMLSINGKEMPHASLTSHQFLEYMRSPYTKTLREYQVNDLERHNRFWQCDPLAVNMDTQDKIEQKLEYMHSNSLQERWKIL